MKVRTAVSVSPAKFSLVFLGVMGLILTGGCAGKSQSHIAQKKEGAAISSTNNAIRVIKNSDKVKVNYTGRLEDGTVFDKSQEGMPLEFIVGSGQIIPGFDRAVVGMKLNEKKEVSIVSQDAYGPRDEDRIRKFFRADLPQGFNPGKNMPIQMQDDTGRIIPGVIIDMDDENVTVDLNHPLAGKTLVFDIEVVSIE